MVTSIRNIGRMTATALLALVMILGAACQGESPTAPTDTGGSGGNGGGNGGGNTGNPVITLSVSNPTPLISETSTITATVTQNGAPVPNGTAIEFSTTLGTFASTGAATTIRTTTNGVATDVLSSTTTGTATITVRIGTSSATATVTFGDPGIILSASNTRPIVNTTTVITAQVTGAAGAAPDGTPVQFTTTLGTFVESSSNTTTRPLAGGRASITLTSPTAGQAVVTATVNGRSETIVITFEQPGLRLAVSNATPVVGTNTTVSATATGPTGAPVADDTLIVLTTSLGTFVESGSNTINLRTVGGSVSATLTSSAAGRATVTARLDAVTQTIDVEFGFPDFSLSLSNASPLRNETITATASIPAAAPTTVVVFTTDRGRFVATGTNTVEVSAASGTATAQLTADVVGPVNVTARVGDRTRSATANYRDPDFTLSVSNPNPFRNETVRITANVPGAGTIPTRVRFTTTVGRFVETNSTTAEVPVASGEASVNLLSTSTGTVVVTAQIGDIQKQILINYQDPSMIVTVTDERPLRRETTRFDVTLTGPGGTPLDVEVEFRTTLGTWVGTNLQVITVRTTNGRASATLHSDDVGNATVTIRAGDRTETRLVTFVDPTVDISLSTIRAVSGSNVTVTARVNDEGRPIEDEVVFTTSFGVFEGSNAATIRVRSVGGVATATLRGNTAGNATVTARVGTSTDQENVQFVDPSMVLNVSDPTPIRNGSTTITALLSHDGGSVDAEVEFRTTFGVFVATRTNVYRTRSSGGIATAVLTSTGIGEALVTAQSGASTQSASVRFIDPNVTLTISNGTPLRGESSTVTAFVTDDEGRRVDAEVLFSTTLGRFVESNATTVRRPTTNGVATATLTSDAVGAANVTGKVGDNTSAPIVINFIDPNFIVTVSDPNPFTHETTTITARVFNDGVPADAVVEFVTTHGRFVDTNTATTRVNTTAGLASAVLSADAEGEATITVRVGERTQNVTVRFVDPVVTVTAINPSPMINETSEIRVTITKNGAPFDADVQFTTDFGRFVESGSTAVTKRTSGGVATTQITSERSGDATITVRVGNVIRTVTVSFQDPPPPDLAIGITSISPTSGSPAGGQVVTIRGKNFRQPLRVTFGGVDARIISATESEIRVITPAINLGPTEGAREVDVVVIGEVGTSNQQSAVSPQKYRYELEILTPSVFTVSPASGPNEGNTRITIFGEGFQAPVKVFFVAPAGERVEVEVLQVTYTQIIALTPPALGLGAPLRNEQVSVLVQNIGSSRESDPLANAFRYGPDINITAIEPTQGSSLGGTRVTIHGWGFDEPVQVLIAGAEAQVISVSGTQIVAVTRGLLLPCSGVSGPVTVTNIEDGQNAVSPTSFAYIPVTPAITNVVAAAGVPNPGESVTATVVNPTVGNVAFTFGGQAVAATPTNNTNGPGPVDFVFTIPSNLTFQTAECTSNGSTGTQLIPTSFNLEFRNTTTDCTVTVPVIVTPNNTACQVPNLIFNPAPVAFGNQPACFQGPEQVVTITNNGAASTTLTAPTVNNNQFAISTPLSTTTLGPGNSATFGVRFTPAGVAPAAGTISVGQSAGPAATVNVSGTGVNPTIASISPNNGPAAGGNAVTITGSGFRPGATVSFGPNVVVPTAIDPNGNFLTVNVPPGVAGPVNVTVSNPGGCGSVTSVSGYNYNP